MNHPDGGQNPLDHGNQNHGRAPLGREPKGKAMKTVMMRLSGMAVV
jgi:hypothetical protein